jgi:hypothetical protein
VPHSRAKEVAVKFLVVAVALALTVLAPPVAAGNGQREHRTGYLALAEFVSTNSSGCVVTTLPLYLRDGLLRDAPGRPDGPFLDIDPLEVRNTCTGEMLLQAYGSTTAFDLRVEPQLAAATLTARVPMFDCLKVVCDCAGEGCPAPTFVLDLDLTWTANGKLQRLGEGADGRHEHFHEIIGGDVRNVAWNGVTREMVVTGTATDGATDYAREPSASAELRRETFTWVNAPRGA